MTGAREMERVATGAGAVERWEVMVIGAGLSGMYQLYRLRELGFNVHVYEAGGGVGGTWYWNRYPGARFDSESWTYGFSFDKELLRRWNWVEHLSGQPENLRYCNFVADMFDLRRDIIFNARVKGAAWDEAANEWAATFENGRRARPAISSPLSGRSRRQPCRSSRAPTISRAKPGTLVSGRISA